MGRVAVLTDLQTRTIQSVVNVFETGLPLGNYGRVTVMEGDAGHVSYGRSQTTLGSGGLFFLIRDYCRASNATHARALHGYLEPLEARDPDLDRDDVLHGLLRDAGEGGVMRHVQDAFFDRRYWEPSLRAARDEGISTALGVGVVYDSRVHGGWRYRRDETRRRLEGRGETPEERDWVREYLDVRRSWLLRRGYPLSNTVYRMDAFQSLVDAGNWSLDLPLLVRGAWIDEDVLRPSASQASADAEQDVRPILRTDGVGLAEEAVLELQRALRRSGFPDLACDGDFGPATAAAVRAFQGEAGLLVDGIVGPATWEALTA